ncbi:MAG: ADP-forming succinate--CoA ligase subunit beta [Myxococcota bacterium]
MKLHEYQAKEILREFGIHVLPAQLCRETDQVSQACEQLGFPCVIKAQVHAGGRGKAGGVKVVHNLQQAQQITQQLLGKQLITAQSAPHGQPVQQILIEAGCDIEQELYVGLVLDRQRQQMCLLGCAQGGVEIEQLAESDANAIVRQWIDPLLGLMPYQARQFAWALGCSGSVHQQLVKVVLALASIAAQKDVSMLEINPLVITKQQQVIALDAKMTIDDSALFRQPDLAKLHDVSQEDAREVQATQHALSYVALDGNIGCMVNGAGLAMATMDIVQHVGGKPANFLDVGGSATQQRVEHALEIILADKGVQAVLINIFGGIVQCDVVAKGLLQAAKQVCVKVPMVVRLQGTRSQEGKALLQASDLNITPADTLLDAASKVVQQAAC